MSDWIRIAAVEDVPPGTGRELTAAGRVVALFNVEGQFYALDGVCPHAGGPLGEGRLSGRVVTCPWHGWQFDVTSGRHCLNANITHTAFPVRVEDGQVLVELPT
ncbi:MAG: non-heme iron oxygenase ferredoxin subunit [Planctomycetes bacterium]|nr:non-heme iron oxygenase ferredoxin subunit [Planctomycetota bacterium]